jgi:circadian clock protein KaiB
LYLYISGLTPRSGQALRTIRRLCDQYLPGRHRLKVIDIYQQPDWVKKDQVIAVPTLILKAPAPVRRLVGDLSDEHRVRTALGLPSPEAP